MTARILSKKYGSSFWIWSSRRTIDYLKPNYLYPNLSGCTHTLRGSQNADIQMLSSSRNLKRFRNFHMAASTDLSGKDNGTYTGGQSTPESLSFPEELSGSAKILNDLSDSEEIISDEGSDEDAESVEEISDEGTDENSESSEEISDEESGDETESEEGISDEENDENNDPIKVPKFTQVDIKMLPIVVLVGRPNVGKSALFNKLIKRREALVHNTPDAHMTRDVREAVAKLGNLRFKVLDSAGLEADAVSDSVLGRTREMTAKVLGKAHMALFLIDGRCGLHPLDMKVARWLRRNAPELPVVVAMNKAEGMYNDYSGLLIANLAEANALGFGEPVAISAESGEGLNDLYDSLSPQLHEILFRIYQDASTKENNCSEGSEEKKAPLQLAIAGRPNVGKSTLLNTLMMEERVLTGPEPGLTRDSVRVEFEYEGRKIFLVDTAGWLKQTQVKERTETLSASRTRKCLLRSHIVTLVLDGDEIARSRLVMKHSEAQLSRMVVEEGRGLVVIVNKMDLLKGKENARMREAVMEGVLIEVQKVMPQVTSIPVVFISALEMKGRSAVLRKITEAYERWCLRLSTAQLNSWLRRVAARHSWRDGAHGPKVKYMTQVKARPPTFVVFVRGKPGLSQTDTRFLTNSLIEDFNLGGIPIRVVQRLMERGLKKGKRDKTNTQSSKKKGSKLTGSDHSDKR